MNAATTEPGLPSEDAREPGAEGLAASGTGVVLSADVTAAIVKGWIDEQRPKID